MKFTDPEFPMQLSPAAPARDPLATHPVMGPLVRLPNGDVYPWSVIQQMLSGAASDDEEAEADDEGDDDGSGSDDDGDDDDGDGDDDDDDGDDDDHDDDVQNIE